VGKDKLEAAAEVFTKPDVPEEVKEAVDSGEVSVTRAAEAVKQARAEKAKAARAAVASEDPSTSKKRPLWTPRRCLGLLREGRRSSR